ncbi:hypothetical protein [Streptomyces sp. NPDC059176]|uniref:hypothetical protein n=1 Tax=Streptomyces sp. NPDC059176 TaxID=3346758 RepID=UPI0036B170F0
MVRDVDLAVVDDQGLRDDRWRGQANPVDSDVDQCDARDAVLGQTAPRGQSFPKGRGRKDSRSTAATSTAFVETGVTLIPVMQRVYQSIPTESSACTQRSVSGSKANTSSRVESISRYSPGLVGRSFP